METAEATSRVTDHSQHAHVIRKEDKKEVDIKEDQRSTPRTQRVQNTAQHQSGSGYSTQGSAKFRRAFPNLSPLEKYHSLSSRRKKVVRSSSDEEEERVNLLISSEDESPIVSNSYASKSQYTCQNNLRQPRKSTVMFIPFYQLLRGPRHERLESINPQKNYTIVSCRIVIYH